PEGPALIWKITAASVAGLPSWSQTVAVTVVVCAGDDVMLRSPKFSSAAWPGVTPSVTKSPATSEVAYDDSGARNRIGMLPGTALAVLDTVNVIIPAASVVPFAGVTVMFWNPGRSLDGSTGSMSTPALGEPSKPLTSTVIVVVSVGSRVFRTRSVA